jgi:hypothetical protein
MTMTESFDVSLDSDLEHKERFAQVSHYHDRKHEAQQVFNGGEAAITFAYTLIINIPLTV